MVLKLLGLGVVGYLLDPFNLFDGTIVIISIVEMVAQSNSSGFAILRGFRLLRVLKLIKRFEGLRALVGTMLSSLSEAASLGILIMVYIFVHALIGKSMFNLPLKEEDGTPFRSGFVDMKQSMLTVLLCMTGNWILPMNLVAKEYGKGATFFFVEMVVVGEFMLLSLFMSILLKNSTDVEDFKGHTSGIYDYSTRVIGPLDKAHKVMISVKAAKNVLIALSEEPEHLSKKFEIHIGDDNNMMTKIRFLK
jgi:hypothetical protein